MADVSLADFALFRNQQIRVYGQLETHLDNADALLTVLLTATNLYEVDESTLQRYFSVVADLINEAIVLNQLNLTTLNRQEK